MASGILLAVAFPGTGGRQELAFIALVPLLLAIEGVGWRRAALLGFVSGLTFWLITISWIAGTIVRHGGVPWVLAGAVLLSLAAYLATFTAAFCALVARGPAREGALYVVGAASFWVALEFVRTYLLTGFPWNLLGYSQSRNIPLIQVAAVTGVYGVSFVLVAVNAALARLVVSSAGTRREGVDAVVVAGTVVLAAVGLAWVSPPPHDEPTAPVAVVQANVAQEIKWDPAVQRATLDLYANLTRQAARGGAGLVVWPETAIPFVVRDDPRWPEVPALARDTGIHLLVGAPDVHDGLLRNSAFVIDRDGVVLGRYDKRHLVPFGEYVPLGRLLSFADAIAGSGVGAFAPGTEATVFGTPAGRLGVVICYEAIFPGEVRDLFRGGAEILVNLTNDAWFGRSAAPEQHLAMAILRAVENRAYLIRAANTGISAIIAPDGHVVRASGLFTQEIITGAVAPRGGPSFYTRHGDLFAWTTVAVALAALWPFRSGAWRRWPVAHRSGLLRGSSSRVSRRSDSRGGGPLLMRGPGGRGR